MAFDTNKGVYLVPVAGAIRVYVNKKLYEIEMCREEMADFATEILMKRIEMKRENTDEYENENI